MAAASPLRSRPVAAQGGRERDVDVLSSNGRPGTRRGVRTPHLSAAMPVDAYSLAVSCGGRGVSSDIWPASLVRHAPRRALPFSGTTGLPRPARCVAPRPVFAATPVSRHCASPRHAASWPSVVPPPSARYRGYGGPCLAMRRPPTPLRCGLALGRHPPAGDAITPGSSVPATSLCGDQVMRGTLAPRHHAGTNFLLTETLAATGLEADFAPRHYRVLAPRSHAPHR